MHKKKIVIGIAEKNVIALDSIQLKLVNGGLISSEGCAGAAYIGSGGNYGAGGPGSNVSMDACPGGFWGFLCRAGAIIESLM